MCIYDLFTILNICNSEYVIAILYVCQYINTNHAQKIANWPLNKLV